MDSYCFLQLSALSFSTIKVFFYIEVKSASLCVTKVDLNRKKNLSSISPLGVNCFFSKKKKKNAGVIELLAARHVRLSSQLWKGT